jgi:hypothetical protein
MVVSFEPSPRLLGIKLMTLFSGMLLFVFGAAPFLAGITYTTTYPSSDIHVIACLVVGACFLIAYAL